MSFSDVGTIASILGTLTSLISLAVSIWVLLELRDIRNVAKLRVRGPRIIRELGQCASNLSGFLDEFDDALPQIDDELATVKAKLKYLKKSLPSDTKSSVKRLLKSIEKCEIALDNKDGIRRIYVEMNQVLEEVKDHQKDIRSGVSTEKNKWVEAVAKLIQLTQQGELKWNIAEPPPSFSRGPNARVEILFIAKYGEKNLRLYERRFQEEFVDFDEFELRPVPKTQWTRAVVLEFTDEDGNSLWAFPSVEALNDLMSAVQYQVAGVKEFLTELLAS